jgi:hypothetical protein
LAVARDHGVDIQRAGGDGLPVADAGEDDLRARVAGAAFALGTKVIGQSKPMLAAQSRPSSVSLIQLTAQGS